MNDLVALCEATIGRIAKLKLKNLHTQESIKSLIELYGAWNKPEKVEQWRAKLPSNKDDGK